MKDLFSKLGEIAQAATGGALPGINLPGAGSQNIFGQSAQQPPVQGSQQSAPGTGFSAENLLGSLKNSVPGGVGGLLGAGALGGILGALLSGGGVGKTVRKLGEGALVMGGTAAAAGLAWKLYQKWSQPGQEPQQEPWQGPTASPAMAPPAPLPAGEPAQGVVSARQDAAAMLVLEAMVSAARADGHMDATEREAVHAAMGHLFPGTDVAASLEAMMNKPLDPEDLARRVQNPEQAMDLYRLSRMIVVVDHAMERAYMDALAAALHIPKATQASLDEEVAALQAGAANTAQ